MSIDTTFLRRCLGALQRALDGIGVHSETGDFLCDVYRATGVKESGPGPEQSGKLLRKRLAIGFRSRIPGQAPSNRRLRSGIGASAGTDGHRVNR